MITQFQCVQNAAARLLTTSRKCDHIAPILASCHWLLVRLELILKILVLTFKALHGMTQSYLAELLNHYSPARSLWRSDKALLATPRSRLKTKADRAFAVRAPTLWNSLPEELRLEDSLLFFQLSLKTHFDHLAFSELFYLLLISSVLLRVLLSIILSLLLAVLFVLVIWWQWMYIWLFTCFLLFVLVGEALCNGSFERLYKSSYYYYYYYYNFLSEKYHFLSCTDVKTKLSS